MLGSYREEIECMGDQRKKQTKQTAKQIGIRGSNLLWSIFFIDFHTSLDSPDNFTQNDNKIYQILKK